MSVTFANKSSLLDPCGMSNKPKPERPYVLATDQFGVSYRLYSKDLLVELLAHVRDGQELASIAEEPWGFGHIKFSANIHVCALLRGKVVVGYKLDMQSFMLRHVEVQSR